MKLSKLRTKVLRLAMAGTLALAASTTVLAHHPIQAKFDMTTAMDLEGIVTLVDWSNPHVHVFVNVGSGKNVQNWAVELESPIFLKKSGWNSTSLKPGDKVKVHGPKARNGTRQVWADTIKLSATGDAVYTLKDTAPIPPLAKRPAPRTPDGHVALGATAGTEDGYWAYPTSKALVEDGVKVKMDKYGQLASIEDAAKVAPMQEWALALYKRRQLRNLQDDPEYINCKPPGGPRQFQSDLGVKFLEDIPGQRMFVLFGSGNHNYRLLYLDGRKPVGQVTGDDNNPLYYGRSVGKWDGDTLAIDTVDFNEDFWFSNGGLPHTSMLTLHEKFSRPDMDTLHYEVTVDDPGAYTRPWTASWDLRWVGGEELPVHFCQDNRP